MVSIDLTLNCSYASISNENSHLSFHSLFFIYFWHWATLSKIISLRVSSSIFDFFYDRIVVIRHMGQMAVQTCFCFLFAAVFIVTAALLAQRIQWAVTKQAVEFAGVRRRMAREILAFTIDKKPVAIRHAITTSFIRKCRSLSANSPVFFYILSMCKYPQAVHRR